MSMASGLFKLARIVATFEAATSSNPKKAPRRLKNILLGRFLGRAGIWRFLWK